jgi:hypothetical protein
MNILNLILPELLPMEKRMKAIRMVWILICMILFSCNEETPPVNQDNALSIEEKNGGWILLFDGQSSKGWRGYNRADFPNGWRIIAETLVSTGKGAPEGGDIIYNMKFNNFHLKLDWKISKGGNSGIYYHVQEGEQYKTPYQTGPEYQLIDDIGFPGKLHEWQKTGADYAMYLPDTLHKKLKAVGEWNTAQIIFNNGHVEHWLNGIKITEFEAWTEDWSARVMASKWKNSPGYGRARSGYIGLQDHDSMIWFKNIKIKPL